MQRNALAIRPDFGTARNSSSVLPFSLSSILRIVVENSAPSKCAACRRCTPAFAILPDYTTLAYDANLVAFGQ